jgi:hypothetical protein
LNRDKMWVQCAGNVTTCTLAAERICAVPAASRDEWLSTAIMIG